MTGPSSSTWWAGRQLARYLPARYAVGGALWASMHTLPVLAGLALKVVFDRLAAGGTAGAVLPLLAVFVAAEVVRVLVFWTAMVLWPAWWQSVLALLRTNMLRSLLLDSEPPVARLPGSPAEAVSRFRDDAVTVVWFVDIWVDIVGGVVFSAIALAVMLRIDPVVTLVVGVPLVVVLVTTRFLTHRIRAVHGASRESAASVGALLGDAFGNALAVKVAGAEDAVIGRFRARNHQRARAVVRANLYVDLLPVVSQASVELSIGLVLLLAAPAMRRGDFTVGDLALFTTYLGGLTGLPRWVGRMLARHRESTVAFDRMARLLPGRRVEEVVRHRRVYVRQPPPSPPPGMAPVVVPLERFAARHLTSRHGSAGGIEGVDVDIAAGHFTVVTGAVGSGKSTLLRAVLGLLPLDEGELRWNGEPVDDPASFLVPPRAAYVAQVPRLVSASLGENLVLGWPVAGDDVDEALRLAALDVDVQELTDGLATTVGPRGARLSGGQLQRATVARALIRRPQLLLVDDLSSALDVETEQRLWSGVTALSGTALLVVSHRRWALERADSVIVLDRGRVAGTGPLPDLLESCAEMRRLWSGAAAGRVL